MPSGENPNQSSEKKLSKRNDLLYLDDVFPDTTKLFGFRPKPLVDLTKNCVFVLDANVLLDTHSFSKQSISKIAEIYLELAENKRLVVPARAVQEYLKNRHDRLEAVYSSLTQKMTSLQVIEDLKPIPKLDVPMLEHINHHETLKKIREESLKLRRNYFEEVEKYKQLLQEMRDNLAYWSWKDQVSELFSDVFGEHNIVKCLKTSDELESDLAWRVKFQVPPGHKDANKPDGGVGDLMIWHTMLQIGAEGCADVVFVTNEKKTDWVNVVEKKVIGAKDELLYEFNAQCSSHFQIINYETFLETMGAGDDVVEQAKEIQLSVRNPGQEERLKRQLILHKTIHACDVIASANSMLECFDAVINGIPSFVLINYAIKILSSDIENRPQFAENKIKARNSLLVIRRYVSEIRRLGETEDLNSESVHSRVNLLTKECRALTEMLKAILSRQMWMLEGEKEA